MKRPRQAIQLDFTGWIPKAKKEVKEDALVFIGGLIFFYLLLWLGTK